MEGGRPAHLRSAPSTLGPGASPSHPRQGAAAMSAVLEVNKVTVSFDGFRALNNLTLTLESGELRCLVGPNGAGKTTLMDVITGKTRPDTGTVRFAEHDITRYPEHEIVALGIGRKFQRPTVF